MVVSLHPNNRRVGSAGLPIPEYLNYYRRPGVFVTEHGSAKHETPLCPHVRGHVHRMICREEALYVYGENWCETCWMNELTLEGTGWTDPRYREDYR